MIDEPTLLSVLVGFSETVVVDCPVQRVLDELVLRAVELLDVGGAGVTLVEHDRPTPRTAGTDASARVLEQRQQALHEGPSQDALLSGRTVAAPELAEQTLSWPRLVPLALDLDVGAVFAFPLRHAGTPLGVLTLHRSTPGPLSARGVRVASTLCTVVGSYIANAQDREHALALSDVLRAEALADPLTGLANRTMLHQRIETAVQRARRSHAHSAVLFADLDCFKEVNDRHGHAVGDALLVEVAARLRTVVRAPDTLARLGGDEFVVLCEDLADEATAQDLVERMQAAFRDPFRICGAELDVTASVGLAYSGSGDGLSYQLVLDADEAMYAAKHQRRAQAAQETVGEVPAQRSR